MKVFSMKTPIKLRENRKVFMLYQNIRGDLHEHSVALRRYSSTLKVAGALQNKLQNGSRRRKTAICFQSIMLWSFFISSLLFAWLLKNLENLCGNASSCFVSHLPFTAFTMNDSLLLRFMFLLSCLNKQFTGNSRISTAILHSIISLSIEIEIFLSSPLHT